MPQVSVRMLSTYEAIRVSECVSERKLMVVGANE